MHYKQASYCIILLIGLTSSLMCAQTLNIIRNDGQKYILSVDNIKKLTFSSNGIRETRNTGLSYIYYFTDIRKMTFSEEITQSNFHIADNFSDFVIYPNPSKITLNIRIVIPDYRKIKLEILTTAGIVIYQQIYFAKPEINEYKIDISEIPDGMYVCRFFDGSTMKVKKIIK